MKIGMTCDPPDGDPSGPVYILGMDLDLDSSPPQRLQAASKTSTVPRDQRPGSSPTKGQASSTGQATGQRLSHLEARKLLEEIRLIVVEWHRIAIRERRSRGRERRLQISQRALDLLEELKAGHDLNYTEP